MRDDFVPLSGGSRRFRPSAKGSNLFVEEIGWLPASDHPEVQAVIQELAELGGQLRLHVTRMGVSGKSIGGTAHFRYDLQEGIPVISISPEVDLHGLEHEFTHFKDWKRARERLVRSGLRGEAFESALRELYSKPEDVQRFERNAVGAELRSRARQNRAVVAPRVQRGGQNPSRALPAVDLKEFVSLITYPEREGLSRALESSPTPTGEAAASVAALMDEAVRKGLALRRAQQRRLTEKLRRMTEGNIGSPAVREQLEGRAGRLLHDELLFDELFNAWNMEGFEAHKGLLQREFDRALERRKGD